MDGFWRPDNSFIIIFECPNPDACHKGKCIEGHEGPLCDSCVSNGSGIFFKSPANTCVQCKNALNSYIIMSLVTKV